MRGQKKGRVHEGFKKLLDKQRDDAKKIAESLTGTGTRPWQIPTGAETVDLLDVPKLHEPAFERTEINGNYNETLKSADDPGTNGDAMSLKFQVDLMAVRERAFRLRHATPVRCIILAHGRRQGHGHDQVVFDAQRRHAENLLQAGSIGDPPGASVA